MCSASNHGGVGGVSVSSGIENAIDFSYDTIRRAGLSVIESLIIPPCIILDPVSEIHLASLQASLV